MVRMTRPWICRAARGLIGGRYQVLEPLARGGQASAYLALDRLHGAINRTAFDEPQEGRGVLLRGLLTAPIALLQLNGRSNPTVPQDQNQTNTQHARVA